MMMQSYFSAFDLAHCLEKALGHQQADMIFELGLQQTNDEMTRRWKHFVFLL